MAILLPDILCIIDQLHGDKSTLTLCSQVCRDWLSPSRFHLFSVVHAYEWDPEFARVDILVFDRFLCWKLTIYYYVKLLEVHAIKMLKPGH